jgi:ABC-type multidrug transport system permease subunit
MVLFFHRQQQLPQSKLEELSILIMIVPWFLVATTIMIITIIAIA